MNDQSHLLMSLSYTLDDPRVPGKMRKAAAEITRLTAEVERKDAALKQAGTGLNAGLFQYAARDIHGNIVPGDEQYPWIRAMQIGLDAVTAALRPHSQETNND